MEPVQAFDRSGSAKSDLKQQVKAAFDQCCAYCGKPARLTLDHLVAASKGGSEHRRNLVPACKRCNQSKGSQALELWYTPALSFYAQERWQRIRMWMGMPN